MRTRFIAFTIAAALAGACTCGTPIDSSVPARIEDGVIVLQTPPREAGQQSALGLTADPIENVHVGIIGLGMRGSEAIRRYTYVEGATIAAVCDLDQKCIDANLQKIAEAGLPAPTVYTGENGWKELCQDPVIDLVYVVTDWEAHVDMSVYAMEQGKHVAVEVPAAMNIADCWRLVNTCEKTRKHCMMLENCIYDFFEMTALNMAQQGVFGEIYHAEGAYIHDLEVFWPKYKDCWRLKYNCTHRGDIYPTHGFGPVCQALNIHRGDKMDFLVSMDTKPYIGAEKAREMLGVDEFANGEHTVTLIRTAQGKQIEIQHNVNAKRPYNRMYQLTGTKGFANKYPTPGFALGDDCEKFVSKAEYDALMAQYKPQILADIQEMALKVGGHGGMDFVMDSRLIYCLRHGLPLDEDVYDAAEWSCLTELSRLSIEHNSMPVRVPDFTRGDWDKVQGYKHAIAE